MAGLELGIRTGRRVGRASDVQISGCGGSMLRHRSSVPNRSGPDNRDPTLNFMREIAGGAHRS
jgi:hypothetical protein